MQTFMRGKAHGLKLTIVYINLMAYISSKPFIIVGFPNGTTTTFYKCIDSGKCGYLSGHNIKWYTYVLFSFYFQTYYFNSQY